MKKAFILIFFFTIAINAQNTSYSKIEQIDNFVSSIPLTMVKANGFDQIEASGLTFKKSWIFFKRRVGSFHQMIIHKDDLVYLIQKITKNKKGVFLEKYYYENNKLVKYVKEVPEENFDIEALIIKSISLNKSWLDTITQSNHYF